MSKRNFLSAFTVIGPWIPISLLPVGITMLKWALATLRSDLSNCFAKSVNALR